MNKLAILASGNGSNAQSIIDYFQQHPAIQVNLIGTNKSDAFVLQRANNANIPAFYFQNNQELVERILLTKPDYIILAGFLKKIPELLIEKYPQHILNIHPSLLPAFGGKGMFGIHVHQAVKNAGVSWSGITIHLVNEEYDKGKIIFQQRMTIHPEWDAEKLQQEILKLEHFYYPRVIEKYIDTIFKENLLLATGDSQFQPD